jgi:HK97 family phage portal protein
MSLFFPRQQRSTGLGAFAPPGPTSTEARMAGNPNDRSLRVSAVWAARRLRASLISTLPRDVYRKLPDGRSVEVARTGFFTRPSSLFDWQEWVYATQMDLDAYGNAFGIVTVRDGAGRPASIELSSAKEWTVRLVGGAPQYRRLGVLVDTFDVWHERQYVVPGVPVGLSPVAYGAMSVEHNLSAQEFALQWFTSGAAPSGVLRNRERVLDGTTAQVAKDRFKAATQRREPFVAGADWEWHAADAAGSDAKFLDAMGATSVDVARYFDVPADLIDAAVSGQSITYANITERMLQFLVVHLGPAIARRENVLSERLLAAPRFMKLNSEALLRMDPAAKMTLLGSAIDSRIRTPDEARAILDLEPLTEDDYMQFDRLFPRNSAAYANANPDVSHPDVNE